MGLADVFFVLNKRFMENFLAFNQNLSSLVRLGSQEYPFPQAKSTRISALNAIFPWFSMVFLGSSCHFSRDFPGVLWRQDTNSATITSYQFGVPSLADRLRFSLISGIIDRPVAGAMQVEGGTLWGKDYTLYIHI
jgi:hypothetical protein